MSRHSTRQPCAQPLHANDRPLYRSVSRGIGEWATVPVCVREAIGELLRNTNSQATPATARSARATYSDANLSSRAQQPLCDSSYIPASARDILLPSLAPLTPLSDESVLMSVRTFEDAHRLRQHAVHNTALFHNNVEQLSKEMRYFLLPELRAAIQLRPEVMDTLRERTYHGAEFHAAQHGVSDRMRFEESLLNDVLDSLHALRKASIRFSSNFLSDSEKRDLGISPAALPREQTPRRAHHVSVSKADHSRPSKKYCSSGTFDEVLMHPPSDDTLSDDEQEEHNPINQTRDLSRMSNDRNSIVVQLIASGQQKTSTRGSNNVSAEVEVVPEEAEAYEDRSPRRTRSDQRWMATRSVAVDDEEDIFEDNEPKMSPSLRHEKASSRLDSCQHCAAPVERSAARALYREDDSDVLLEDPLRDEALQPRRDEPSSSARRRSCRPVIDLNPPPPMPGPQKSPLDNHSHRHEIASSAQNAHHAAKPRLSPQQRTVQRSVADVPSPLLGAPSSLSGSDESLGVSPPHEGRNDGDESDEHPRPVPRPGTPRAREDFVIIPTPRSISVKKKTVMIPRSASSERSHSQQGTPHAHDVSPIAALRGTPTNTSATHERRHRTPRETVWGDGEGASSNKSPLRSRHSFTVPK